VLYDPAAWRRMLCSGLTRMKLSQIAVLAYGVLYFILACSMEAENLNQSYPFVYVVLSMIAQTLVVGGIFLFGLEVSSDFAKIWRWLFPLLLIEVAVGIGFDATIPPEPHGSEWILNLVFSLWLTAPAYYFNFRVAHYGR
jgi:hypothetical protein